MDRNGGPSGDNGLFSVHSPKTTACLEFSFCPHSEPSLQKLVGANV